MKWYVASFNGMLDDLKKKVANHLTTPRDADVWCVWQDCQGSYADLIKTAKQLGVAKPSYVVQHGGAASRDYDAPNSFPLNADRFLAWGQSDVDRMTRLGYGDRVTAVGCPLNAYIQPKVPHSEKVVLFVPVNTGKEEPENIAVYYELLKLRYAKAGLKVLEHRAALKDKWGFNGKLNVSFNELASGFDVVAKLLPWHDKNLYHGNTLSGHQDLAKNNQLVFNLLRNVDLVVGLDEGTTETFAYGHDVPVIIVDGFKYRQHKSDGRAFSIMDPQRTPAAMHVELSDLGNAVEFCLAHPEFKREERKAVAEAELGLSLGNATENIFKLIRREMKGE